MIFTANDRTFAESLFKSVADATRATGGGVCRSSYGRNESTAWKIIADAATRHDLYALPDAATNLVITAGTPLIPPKAVWVGSHLDSVPHGGNYDGLAGVVAALLMVTKARETKGRVPIVGLGLRGEESAWFGVPYLGSKALLGQLRHRDLDRSRRPEDENDHQLPTLAEALEQLGARPRQLVQTPIFPPGEIGEFWELHIEQGPVLVAKHKPIGVVTGIRGNVRASNARITGKAGHSGTTPHDLRNDAVVKFAEVVTKLEARRRILTETFAVAAQRRWAQDLVFTCGIVSTNPKKHSITTIADEITFALDVRSLDDQTTKDFVAYAESLGVCLGETVETRSARIAPEMWTRAKRACENLGVDHEVMPSGAGHDAAVFQQAGVPSGMIFIRNENGSHNPDEGMNLDDFMLGCEVLWKAITEGRL